MEDLLYWIIEYVKVLVGYGFIMFIWPSAVFRKYLRGKSVTFRFGFCVTVQVVLVSTVVLMLGLVHILNQWTMWIFFYGLFIWSFREKYKVTENTKRKFKYLVTGTFGWKHLLLLTWEGIVRFAKRILRIFWKFYKVHWLEYTLLVVTVIYSMIYFSWGVFHDHSYGFSDMYVHNSWVYQLSQGNPFSGGIYPQGMHCVLYSVNALFGVRIFSCMLFVPGINIAVTLIAAYCFMKEIFHWRYSAVFVLVIFSTMELTNRLLMISMARAQCALPQEFGLPVVILCAMYLLCYLRSEKNNMKEDGAERKWIADENLFLFVMAFTGTIVIHFYNTLMAFYVCLAIAVICWRKVFSKKCFVSLVAAVILGLVIAVVPMVIGVITGIRLEGSLYWAMNLIKGSTSANTEVEVEIPESIEAEYQNTENITTQTPLPGNAGSAEAQEIQESDVIYQEVEVIYQPTVSLGDKIKNKVQGIGGRIQEKWQIIREKAFNMMYEKPRADMLIALIGGIVLSWIIYRALVFLLNRKREEKINITFGDGYMMIVLAAFIYFISFSAIDLGLPLLMEGYRTGFIHHMLVVMLVVVPLDVVYILLQKICRQSILQIASLGTAVAMVILIYQTDNWHGYLYFEVTRFDATVEVTNDIIESLPVNSYTIVSPTEELYQVIAHGRHEELLTFCSSQARNRYTIPTEYIFLFVEKNVLRYAQYHFFDGPKWLAVGKYQNIYGGHSVWPEYLTAEISEEAANQGIMYYRNDSDSYTKIDSRVILQSRMYEWCERFKELYPNELKTYYEDDNFVCYYFRQNTQSSYNLALK